MGDHHPSTVHGVIQLPEYERRPGWTAEAEALYRDALPVLDSIVEGRAAVAPALTGLGMLLAETGRCAEAEPYLRRAVVWSAEARAGLASCSG